PDHALCQLCDQLLHLRACVDRSPSSGLLSALVLPRARRLTLFPYTTLFRSLCGAFTRGSALEGQPPRRLEHPLRTRPMRTMGMRDRKSTRLNSSHVKNSYAVFCLKKKKIELISSRLSPVMRPP